MTAAGSGEGGDAEAALAAIFARAGAEPVDPPILQPADPFLDLLGEEFRHRIYLTADPQGRELCLRPDFTIPVAQHHAATKPAGARGLYSYRGPVFRYRADEPRGEFLQAGIESFGRPDTEAADAEILSLALESVRACGLEAPRLTLGDAGLFAALIAALDLPKVWSRRLTRHFGRPDSLSRDLAELRRQPAETGSALGALDPSAARALVREIVGSTGLGSAGGRTVAEIADRFIEQATLAAGSGVPPETVRLIERYLEVSGEPARALDDLGALARGAGLGLEPALSAFARRLELLRASGIDLTSVSFSTAFGRAVDYYTGFIFEIHDPAAGAPGQAAGGGRYDRLLTLLGASSADAVPAVGFSLWLERLPLGQRRPSRSAG